MQDSIHRLADLPGKLTVAARQAGWSDAEWARRSFYRGWRQRSRVLDVRILTPVDLAVSRPGRFSEQDRADIAALARRGLVSASSLEQRTLESLWSYVGDAHRLRGGSASAEKTVETSRPKR